MDAATLTDRYVDAAMRTVPEKQRADLSLELAASIADQIEARTDAGEPADQAARAVLTELGDPEALAAGYTGRPLHLIGPRYYLDWWRLLKVLLWIVIPFAGAGVALGKVLSGAPVGDVIGSIWVTMLTAGLHVAFWTTLIFVILERTGHETMDATPWTPDKLPEPKETGAKFSDMVAAIVSALVLAGLVLWDLWLGFVPGQRLSFLSAQLWPTVIVILFVLLALKTAVAIAVHVRGRWTARTATANLVIVLLIAGTLAYNTGHILNPAFFETLMGADADNVYHVLGILGWFLLAGIAVWDVVDTFLRARRAHS
jgi:hypothetical protein